LILLAAAALIAYLRRRFVPRIRATTMLGSPGGFSGGSGSSFPADLPSIHLVGAEHE
jgi:hypothetical protein